ncbi:MAG: hypothetical protein FJX59_12795 [Alphaproteobacteria bacterium]|nr:hypothetical protein [Alphaproteobacteria bacterium]
MEASLWMWRGFTLFVLLLLAFDLGVLQERREVGVTEALKLSLGYVILALIFNAGVFWYFGESKGLEFLTGYVIEKSLRAFPD